MYPDWINSLAILGAACGAIVFALLSVKFNLENRIKENLGKIGIKLLFRQTMICGLIAIVVVFLLCVIPVAFMIGNFTALVGLWVGLSYPLVLMFFRPEDFWLKVSYHDIWNNDVYWYVDPNDNQMHYIEVPK
ncbi:MAG: hypothetical protein HVN34_06935 [Methanobacteriaceae archaeon]|nr:hypothetical protein [Methanobacteriaceae archaeon]